VSDLPTTASELKDAIWSGRCFVAEGSRVRIYLDFVETVGTVRTDTGTNGEDPHTTSASHEDLKLALRLGLREISRDEIPTGGDQE
jgi:hypothetical protein